MKVTHDIVGKINSSQDGVIITMNSLVPCLTSGHGNCPKIVIYESDGYSDEGA